MKLKIKTIILGLLSITKSLLLFALAFLTLCMSPFTLHVCSGFALDIWNELGETYYKADDSVVFNIHRQINNLTQGILYVSN